MSEESLTPHGKVSATAREGKIILSSSIPSISIEMTCMHKCDVGLAISYGFMPKVMPHKFRISPNKGQALGFGHLIGELPRGT